MKHLKPVDGKLRPVVQSVKKDGVISKPSISKGRGKTYTGSLMDKWLRENKKKVVANIKANAAKKWQNKDTDTT